MIYLPPIEQSTFDDEFYSVEDIGQKEFVTSDMSSFAWPMGKLEVGDTVYKFVKDLKCFDVPSENGFVSRLSGLNKYTGKGSTAEEAFLDLRDSIHADFQLLQRKRPFEMSDGEKSKWSNLAGVIDLLEYRMTTPVVVRELGQVHYDKISRPRRIEWLRGESYIIDPVKAPGELMGCLPGQWIEAVVKRDPVNHRVLEIESVNKIKYHIPSESEVKALWESMPEAKLASDDWIW